jgi:hypothetical protein
MKRLRHVCLLPLIAVSIWARAVAQGQPSAPPKGADVLVSRLYEQVVARHPLGIPYGADMKIFAPYLSKGLLHRFDLTVACVKDWHRQNPDPNLKPTVGMFEDGIFSGGSEEAEPTAFHVMRTEPRTDGSSRVYVRLTWQDPVNRPIFWDVAAVVVPENGRLVVDDVIHLKESKGDVDWTLSQGLSAECNGGHWVGDAPHQR